MRLRRQRLESLLYLFHQAEGGRLLRRLSMESRCLLMSSRRLLMDREAMQRCNSEERLTALHTERVASLTEDMRLERGAATHWGDGIRRGATKRPAERSVAAPSQ